MKLLKESSAERHERIKNEYKKWIESDKLPETVEDVDDWAMRRTCRVQNVTQEQFEEALFEDYLIEDTIEQQAQKELDADIVARPNQIERALDEALEENLEQIELGLDHFQNVLLVGEAGTGKSSIVRKWARDNNINLYEVRAAGMDDTDLGGAIAPGAEGTVIRLASTEFDKLNRPNSVLFLDEYNRAAKSVRTNLLELINSHVVPDSREPGGQRFLENFLFTVAAINPSDHSYDTDSLDMAERTRFRTIDVMPNSKDFLNYLTRELTDIINRASNPKTKEKNEKRLNLAKALLSNSEFEFDNKKDIDALNSSEKDRALNYRTFTNLLYGSNGTKEDFLAKWDEYVNRHKKSMAERILSNYHDIDDKANDALKTSPLKQRQSYIDRINNTLGMLNDD